MLSVAFGVGIVVAAAVGALLAVILLDYILNLPAGPRVAILLCAVVGLAYVLWRWVLSPMTTRLSVRDVAGHVEQKFPQFDDRLRSTVDFLRGGVPGSDYMKQRVITEAGDLAATLDMGSAVATKPVWYSLSGGVASVLLLIILSLLASHQFRQIAMSRLFTPFSGMAWPKNVQIDLLGRQATRVPVGQRVDVRMRLAKGDRDSMKAIVFTQYGHADVNGGFVPDSPVEQEFMSRTPEGTYGASLDARVDQNQPAGLMRVWIKSGDDEARLSDIVVVPRLAIKAVTATVTPPKYVTNGEARAVTFTWRRAWP